MSYNCFLYVYSDCDVVSEKLRVCCVCDVMCDVVWCACLFYGVFVCCV